MPVCRAGARRATQTATTRPSRRGATLRRVPPVVTELVVLALVYVGYERVRAAAPTRVTAAYANAALVERAERALRIDVELGLNHWFAGHHGLVTAANVYYQLAHPVVTLVVLVLLYARRRDLYRTLRTALVATSGIALLGYWLLPTAPPRFALAGAVDVLTADPTLFAGSVPQSGLVNLYAAMPSVHAAWSVWVALALWRLLGPGPVGGRLRPLVWAYPLLTTTVVVVTANHYLLDVVAGAALVLACDLAARAFAAPCEARRVVVLLRDVPADA